jgi:hypothetical protein
MDVIEIDPRVCIRWQYADRRGFARELSEWSNKRVKDIFLYRT